MAKKHFSAETRRRMSEAAKKRYAKANGTEVSKLTNIQDKREVRVMILYNEDKLELDRFSCASVFDAFKEIITKYEATGKVIHEVRMEF